MAADIAVLVDAGARMIGGCCGTTPARVAALRVALAR
jgi:methionine synthase I (cobalamin-dependent)